MRKNNKIMYWAKIFTSREGSDQYEHFESLTAPPKHDGFEFAPLHTKKSFSLIIHEESQLCSWGFPWEII